MSHIGDTSSQIVAKMPKTSGQSTYSYKSSLVRQLRWTIGSPQMVEDSDTHIWSTSKWFTEQAHFAGSMLAQLDTDPTKLREFIDDEKDHRLGARFERFIEFWLTRSSQFDCIARRLQWIHNGQTRGEFDFIVQNQCSGQIEHWEVATKFYLGVPDKNDQTLQWRGPGKRDSLVAKLNHLLNKQLRLGESADAKQFLKERDIEIDRTRAWIKGRLFYPLNAQVAHHECLPIGQDHERGVWCELWQLDSLDIANVTLLEKTDWLDPMPDKPVCSKSQFSKALESLSRSPLCCDIEYQNSQKQRFFIVANGWFDDLA